MTVKSDKRYTDEYKNVLYLYETKGVHAVAEHYGKHVRTMQRWKKAGEIPKSAVTPKPTLSAYKSHNENYKIKYENVSKIEDAKKRKEARLKFEKEYGISSSTARRWYKNGIPLKGKYDYKKHSLRAVGVVRKKNGVHGIIKFISYKEGEDPQVLWASTPLYKRTPQNERHVTKLRLKLEKDIQKKAVEQYNTIIDILVSRNEYVTYGVRR